MAGGNQLLGDWFPDPAALVRTVDEDVGGHVCPFLCLRLMHPTTKRRAGASRMYALGVADLNLCAALGVALEAVAAARAILLAECAQSDGPRGEIGHCLADYEAEWAIRESLLAAFPDWGYLGEETGTGPRAAWGHVGGVVGPQ